MYIHIGLHPARDEAIKPAMITAMKEFARAAASQPGNIQAYTIKDQRSDRLAGITIWESQEFFEAALTALRDSIDGVPFDEWQSGPTDVLLADVVFNPRDEA